MFVAIERLDEDLIPFQNLVRVLFRRLRSPRAGTRTCKRNRCGRCGDNRDPGRGDYESPMEIHFLLPLFADVTVGRLAGSDPVRKLEIPTVCVGRGLLLLREPVREL